MKLLIITPYPVLPATAGGKIRTLRIAREFASAGVDVSVLTPYHPCQTPSLRASQPFRLTQVRYPYLLPLLFTGRPFPYGHLVTFHPGLGLQLRRRLRQFDVIQFEQCYLAGLLDHVPTSTTVAYNSHNVDRDYISSECSSNWVRTLATSRIQRLEERLVQRADHVFACSKEDRDRFSELYGVASGEISLAPNGVKPPRAQDAPVDAAFAAQPGLRDYPVRALFSGSNVPHNVEAVQFILQELAPALREQCAFIIQGSCVAAIQGADANNVFVDADSATFEAYAAVSTVGINPIEQGSGTNLKVLHLLAHGLPVVSTHFGMRGYDDLRDGVTIANRSEFAAKLRQDRFPSPPDYAQIEQLYGWKHIARQMIAKIGLLPETSSGTTA